MSTVQAVMNTVLKRAATALKSEADLCTEKRGGPQLTGGTIITRLGAASPLGHLGRPCHPRLGPLEVEQATVAEERFEGVV